ncbi:hypothetical protein ACFSM7_07680 [Clavibacter michiganensis subsp. tessellarius]|uniref:hypothetical protein n=1 Tax=Clavibacter tessellarius TaxID=31965 RepID=UPI003639FB39
MRRRTRLASRRVPFRPRGGSAPSGILRGGGSRVPDRLVPGNPLRASGQRSVPGAGWRGRRFRRTKK